MTQARILAAPRNVERAAPAATKDGLQATKRFEKMQAHCSSHHTAGTHDTPVSTVKAGILWELETEGGQH